MPSECVGVAHVAWAPSRDSYNARMRACAQLVCCVDAACHGSVSGLRGHRLSRVMRVLRSMRVLRRMRIRREVGTAGVNSGA